MSDSEERVGTLGMTVHMAVSFIVAGILALLVSPTFVIAVGIVVLIIAMTLLWFAVGRDIQP